MDEIFQSIGNRINSIKYRYKGKYNGVNYYITEYNDDDNIREVLIEDLDDIRPIARLDFSDPSSVGFLLHELSKYTRCVNCDRSYQKTKDDKTCLICQIDYAIKLLKVPDELKKTCNICTDLFLRNDLKKISCCSNLICSFCAYRMVEDFKSCWYCRSEDFEIEF